MSTRKSRVQLPKEGLLPPCSPFGHSSENSLRSDSNYSSLEHQVATLAEKNFEMQKQIIVMESRLTKVDEKIDNTNKEVDTLKNQLEVNHEINQRQFAALTKDVNTGFCDLSENISRQFLNLSLIQTSNSSAVEKDQLSTPEASPIASKKVAPKSSSKKTPGRKTKDAAEKYRDVYYPAGEAAVKAYFENGAKKSIDNILDNIRYAETKKMNSKKKPYNLGDFSENELRDWALKDLSMNEEIFLVPIQQRKTKNEKKAAYLLNIAHFIVSDAKGLLKAELISAGCYSIIESYIRTDINIYKGG